MELIKSEKTNVNYCPMVVNIKDFRKHDNPEVTRLKIASVGAYDVIVGSDEKAGKFIYFPVGCQIAPDILSFLNLYKNERLNNNPSQKGFFENNGRVKGIRLKGQTSMGFLLPFMSLQTFIADSFGQQIGDEEYGSGYLFDCLVDYKKGYDPVNPDPSLIKTYRIARKYINKKCVKKVTLYTGGKQKKGKIFATRGDINRLVEGQWKQHYDTEILSLNPDALIHPNDLIHISDKWDGTQAVSSYLLCYKSDNKLTRKEKLVKFITKTRPVQYEYVLASHRKILMDGANIGDSGFHGVNEKASRVAAHNELIPHLRKGMMVYYELVGYQMNSNVAWQTREGLDMDYGCVPMQEGEAYTNGKHYKIYVFRITVTNEDGDVFEFSPTDVQNWCKYNGFLAPIERYVGYAKNLYPDINPEDWDWSTQFVKRLANDTNFYMELDSPDCASGAPHEGVVIRFEDMLPHAVKVKTFRHYEREQWDEDAGVVDIENNGADETEIGEVSVEWETFEHKSSKFIRILSDIYEYFKKKFVYLKKK